MNLKVTNFVWSLRFKLRQILLTLRLLSRSLNLFSLTVDYFGIIWVWNGWLIIFLNIFPEDILDTIEEEPNDSKDKKAYSCDNRHLYHSKKDIILFLFESSHIYFSYRSGFLYQANGLSKAHPGSIAQSPETIILIYLFCQICGSTSISWTWHQRNFGSFLGLLRRPFLHLRNLWVLRDKLLRYWREMGLYRASKHSGYEF